MAPNMRWIAGLFCLCSLGMLTPADSSAQWIEKPGKGWIQTSLYHQISRHRFNGQGNRESFFNEDARSIVSSAFVTAVFGVYRGVDVWAQMPFHRLAFNDKSATRVSTGFGDPLLHVRIGPELVGIDMPFPVAVRAGVKLPVAEFPVNSEIVPLTDGQRDWEVMVELGHSFYPKSLYVMGWAGYRWRETHDETDRKPGDEWFGYVAGGGKWGRVTWKFSVEALLGEKWISFTGVRLPLSQSERKLVQITPSLGWPMGPGIVEIGARIPLAGSNYPTGTTLYLGYFLRI